MKRREFLTRGAAIVALTAAAPTVAAMKMEAVFRSSDLIAVSVPRPRVTAIALYEDEGDFAKNLISVALRVDGYPGVPPNHYYCNWFKMASQLIEYYDIRDVESLMSCEFFSSRMNAFGWRFDNPRFFNRVSTEEPTPDQVRDAERMIINPNT